MTVATIKCEVAGCGGVLESALRLDVLDISTIPINKPSVFERRRERKDHLLPHKLVLLHLDVILLVHVRESPLLRDDDLLAIGELVTRTTQSLLRDSGVQVLAPNGEGDHIVVGTHSTLR